MEMKLSEIIIPNYFKKSIPNKCKIKNCSNFYDKYGKQDRDIVVNHNNVLVDGYIMYLVLKQNGIEHAKITISNKKDIFKLYRFCNTIYVFGKHHEHGKEYVWRIPESLKHKITNVFPGDTAIVGTKKGVKHVVVTRVEERSIPPVTIRVKKVIGILNNLTSDVED